MITPARRHHEQGYALLFIFLIAAIVGITLYQAIPRVAFESQRDQEQLLVDRGEQFKRAIQLYFRKYKKYPVKIEDLENTQNIRFLRQRYVDPMTGKSEWRAIHVGPGGVFLDSLTQKKKGTKPQDAGSVNNFITELKPIGDSGTGNGQGGVNVGLRRRPSDGGTPTGDGSSDPSLGNNPLPPDDPNADAALASANTNAANSLPGAVNPNGFPDGAFNPNNPNGINPANSGPAAIRGLLTSPRPGGPPPGVFGGGQINDVGFINGGTNNGPAPIVPPITNGNEGGGIQQVPPGATNVGGNFGGNSSFGAGGSGFPNNGQSPGQTLSSPGGSPLSAGPGGQVVGGGIAGFASKSERPGIKKYHDYSKYNEWEFIYDFAKDTGGSVGNQTGQPLPQTPGSPFGTPAQQLNQQPQPQSGQQQQPTQPTSTPSQ